MTAVSGELWPSAYFLYPVFYSFYLVLADVVELWAFLGRFADLIGLERVPSIAELEADLAAPSGSRNITTSALVCFLTYETVLNDLETRRIEQHLKV